MPCAMTFRYHARPTCAPCGAEIQGNVSGQQKALSGDIDAGSQVTVRGWVRTRRDSKAGLSFVNLSDGSCFAPIQIVATAELSNYESEVKRLSAGCGVIATGTLTASQGAGEMRAWLPTRC